MKWWLPLLIAFGATPTFGEQFSITDFKGGLNSNYSPLTIADNEVQDALNVYFDKDHAIVKREGFEVCGSSKQYSYSGAWSYSDANNSTYLIVRSSDAIIAARTSCNFTIRIATTSVANRVTAVNALGAIWFVDRTQGVYYWNGTSTTYVSGSPRGELIAEFRERICVSGLAHPNGNDLYCSAYLDGTNWTTSSTLATGAALFRVGLNDAYDNITGLFSGYNDAMQIWKNRSMYALYGFDKDDFQIRILTREAGTVDHGSIKPYMGGLVFASERGIEFFNGVQVETPPISDKIFDKTQGGVTSSFNEASWTQTTTADFSEGSLSSTTVTNNSVVLSSNNLNAVTNNSFENGTASTLDNWESETVSDSNPSDFDFFGQIASQSSCGCTLTPQNGSYMGRQGQNRSNVYSAHLVSVDASSTILKSQSITNDGGCAWSTYTFTLDGTTADQVVKFMFKYTGSTTFGPFEHRAYSSTFTVTNNITFQAASQQVNGAGSCDEDLVLVDNIQGGSNTIRGGIYYSPVHNSPNLTSFGSLTVTKSDNGGSQTFYMRSSTNTFTVLSSTPSWTSQLINATIGISSGTYFQVRDDFAITASTQTPTLNDFSVSWFEGVRKPPMASITDEKRYYLSLATSTADSENSATLVLSPGPVWSLWDLKAGAFVSHRGQIYHANNASNGSVYSDFSGTNDAGVAINAFVRTKDYPLGDITRTKLFDSFYAIANSFGSGFLYTDYFLNGRSTAYSLHSLDLANDDQFLSEKINFPMDSSHPNTGKTIGFKFSQPDLDDTLTFYGAILNYRMRRVE